MDETALDGAGDLAGARSLDEHVRDTASVGAAALVAVGLLQTIFVTAGATAGARGAEGHAPPAVVDRCVAGRHASAAEYRGRRAYNA